MIAVTAVSLTACTSGETEEASSPAASPPPSPAPSPSVITTPSPSPSPSPEPKPVEGTLDISWVDTGDGRLLGVQDDAGVDPDRVRGQARRIARALDRHLTAVQGGGEDLVAIRAAWARADDTQLASLTTALGGPDNPITRAEYDINVHWEGRPRVAVTTVHLDRIDGSSAHLDLVFSLAGDTPAALQLFGEGRPPKEEP